jgi:D-alanyl-D-alanine carboxypeptidase
MMNSPRRRHQWLFSVTVVALFVAAAVALPGWGGTKTSGTNPSAPTVIRDSVKALVTGPIPGALLFVRQGDRSYTVTAGYADKVKKTPMRATDVFPIGSTTKSYTAVLVMHLVAERKIALDDPVSKYLPGLLRYGNLITIRELLSQTSGLYDIANDPSFLAPYLHGKLGFAWTPEQLVGFAKAKPLLFAPGTRFSYSNTNYIVLGLLAERVGGESYENLLRDYISRPLKLSHTSLPASNKPLPDVHGYVSVGANGKNANLPPTDSAALSPSYAWSAGGIRATAEDVADFYRGLFSGKLLPKAQVEAMEDTQATGGQYGLGIFPTGGNAYVWGAETQAINTTCGRAWGHGGNFPGYLLLPISSPDGSRQAVLLVNVDPTLIESQMTLIYDVLDMAYCEGVPS